MPPLPRSLSSSYRPSRAGKRCGRPPVQGTGSGGGEAGLGPRARTVGPTSVGSGGSGAALMGGSGRQRVGPDYGTSGERGQGGRVTRRCAERERGSLGGYQGT